MRKCRRLVKRTYTYAQLRRQRRGYVKERLLLVGTVPTLVPGTVRMRICILQTPAIETRLQAQFLLV